MSNSMPTFTLWPRTDAASWQDALASYDDAIAQLPSERLAGHDRWYRFELPALVAARAPLHVTHDEMVRITEWKMARGVWRAPNLVLVRNNAPGAVEEATGKASGLLDVPAKAVAAVSALGGVGPATASAVLAVIAPHRFPFFDEIVTQQMAPHVDELGKIAWTAVYYRKYAAALVARAEVLREVLGVALTATDCERALWAHGIHAGARV